MALKEGSNANSFYKDTGIQITASFYDVYYDGGICALHRVGAYATRLVHTAGFTNFCSDRRNDGGVRCMAFA